MASPSLNKMGKVPVEREGNYASSDKSEKGRDFSRDLGLTLLPGSQIPNWGKTLKFAGSDEIKPDIRRRRRHRKQARSPSRTKDGPTAHAKSSKAGQKSEPLHAQSITRSPYPLQTSKQCGSSIEHGTPLCGSGSVADPDISVSSDQDFSQSPSSSDHAVSTENGMYCNGYDRVECCDGLRDLRRLSQSRKRRRVETDTLGRMSTSDFGDFVSALEVADQSRPSNLSRRQTSGRDAPSENYITRFGPASLQLHHSRRVKRSQCLIGTGNTSPEDIGVFQFVEETALEDFYETSNAIAPLGTSSRPESLKEPLCPKPINVDCGVLTSQDGAHSDPLAEHPSRVNVKFLSTGLDSPSSLLPEDSTGAGGRLAGVKSDILSLLIGPSGLTLPSWKNNVDGKSLEIWSVDQPYHSPRHLFSQNCNRTRDVAPDFGNHSSSTSDLSTTNSIPHSITSKSFQYSRLKLHRSASTTWLPASNALGNEFLSSHLRRRSNSLPELASILSEVEMNNPTNPEAYGPVTPEKSPSIAKVSTPVNLSYYQQHGAPTQPNRQPPHVTPFTTPSQAHRALHQTPHTKPQSTSTSQSRERDPLESATRFSNRTKLAAMLTSYVWGECNSPADLAHDIDKGLNRLLIILPPRLHTKGLVQRILNFVEAFPLHGAPRHVMPVDQAFVQAQSENGLLKAEFAKIQKQNNVLREAYRKLYDTHVENSTRSSNEIERLRLEAQAWKEDATYKSNEMERLRHEGFQWKAQAERFNRLLPRTPPKILPGETMFQRVTQGNAALGVTPAILKVGPARNGSTCFSASSTPVDLTVEETSPAASSSPDTSTSLSHGPSSKGQWPHANEAFQKHIRNKSLDWMNKHPFKDPQNPFLLKKQAPKQVVIDIDAEPAPFVFNHMEEEVQAAEATKKNQTSYASYQEKARVTKNVKTPKFTKAQQRQSEKEHAPAPKVSRKKQKQERLRGPQETREEKLARLEDEKRVEEEDAALQMEQFRQDALERETKEKRDREEIEAMENELMDTMPNVDDDEELNVARSQEQARIEAANKSLRDSSNDTLMFNSTDTAKEPNGREEQEQTAMAIVNHSLDALFEGDDDTMFDDSDDTNEPTVAQKQPEASQVPAAATAPHNESAPALTQLDTAKESDHMDEWADFPAAAAAIQTQQTQQVQQVQQDEESEESEEE